LLSSSGTNTQPVATNMADSSSAAFVPDVSVMKTSWGSHGPSRELTAIGVGGEVGASYTVYATNWKCGDCKADNYPSRNRCHRCRAPKAKALEGSESGTIVNGRENPWREVFDTTSKQLYYFNATTGETSWERPVEMGPAPHATGWFGRGAAGSGAAAKYEEANLVFVARPARKQADSRMASSSVAEGAGDFNIWYGKYLGDYSSGGRGKELAEARCCLEKDGGYTKADKHANNDKFFCLFFARGNCAFGSTCQYHHRIPVRADITRLLGDELHDVFGRDRHKDHREDMDGVGSVLKPCRTLFVGNLAKQKYANPQALEGALWAAFGEWGEVENVNLIARLSIAFVRYRHRAGAEFGKEAMANQTLEQGEVLNVRWAYDDPNPVALEAAQRADADAVVNMLQVRGVALGTAPPPASGGGGGGGGGDGEGLVEGQPAAARAAAAAAAMEQADALAGHLGPRAQEEARWAALDAPAAPAPCVGGISAVVPDGYALPPAKRLRGLDLSTDPSSGSSGASGGGVGGGEGTSEGALAPLTVSEAKALDEVYGAAGVVWYPDTDAQYHHAAPGTQSAQNISSSGSAGSTGSTGSSSTSQSSSRVARDAAVTAAAAAAAAASAAGYSGVGGDGGDGDDAWRPAVDPASGATYFFNQRTGATSWAPPPGALHASAAAAARSAALAAATAAASAPPL